MNACIIAGSCAAFGKAKRGGFSDIELHGIWCNRF